MSRPATRASSRTTTPPTTATATRSARLATKTAAATSRKPKTAYLRIRPQLSDVDSNAAPYLTRLSDACVRLTDPNHESNKYRASTLPHSVNYTFSHVFDCDTSQSDLFRKTTLPLVQDLLDGQNGLCFAYGHTNSGKTYTVQGGRDPGSAGILPRTLDVIFNSIEGLHGDGKASVERADASDLKPLDLSLEPVLAEVLGPQVVAADNLDVDPTVLTLDRNYEYTVHLSYAEVYNERVYDLLATVSDSPSQAQGSKSLLVKRQGLPLRPSPPQDGVEGGGKYIDGLRQFRVTSAAEAKALIKLGQLHRQVFGTHSNFESSRSHGMVIVKLVRVHRGERNKMASLQISRLTLVDLAGSERVKHAQTSGERLKEAGNINKSLMVLGQCLETMRSNQRKLAASLGGNGRIDTRDVKRTLDVVPFSSSKLTQALMDYFVGNGRTIMIVNVNPFDTGFDENSRVMKFAALASKIQIQAAPAPLHHVPIPSHPWGVIGKSYGKNVKQLGPMTLSDPAIAPRPQGRKVTISAGVDAKKSAVLEVLEEDAPYKEGDEHDDDEMGPMYTLIDDLFDQILYVRQQLEECEQQLEECEERCVLVEIQTREEVTRMYEERMRQMGMRHHMNLMQEAERNERKMNAKLDIIASSPVKRSVPLPGPVDGVMEDAENDAEEEEDVEMSLIVEDDEEDDELDASTQMPLHARSSSPLAGKKAPERKKSSQVARPSYIIQPRLPIDEGVKLPSDTEAAEFTETETEEMVSEADDDDDARASQDESVHTVSGYTDTDREAAGGDSEDEDGGQDGSAAEDASVVSTRSNSEAPDTVSGDEVEDEDEDEESTGESEDADDDDDDDEYIDKDDDDYSPPPRGKPKVSKAPHVKSQPKSLLHTKRPAKRSTSPTLAIKPKLSGSTPAAKSPSRLSRLAVEMGDLSINKAATPKPRRSHARAQSTTTKARAAMDLASDDEVNALEMEGSKKKRRLRKMAVMDEDEIEKVSIAIDRQTTTTVGSGKGIRRLVQKS
ncbi:kinesin-domain-containing protein [Fistulina hepatica ATCC 64428]|uniref:Kinesin-domain-containing protein n=1 Tax=Fistulina hepatica ATCC 64428 TaxID=1128425 RepID=A0A0D7A2H2_9AGAR|nr:kinesin-domain-containing protein [Fistulina hepatica ATCC 64428]